MRASRKMRGRGHRFLGVSQVNDAFLKTDNSRIGLLDYTVCRWPDRFVQVLLKRLRKTMLKQREFDLEFVCP